MRKIKEERIEQVLHCCVVLDATGNRKHETASETTVLKRYPSSVYSQSDRSGKMSYGYLVTISVWIICQIRPLISRHKNTAFPPPGLITWKESARFTFFPLYCSVTVCIGWFCVTA